MVSTPPAQPAQIVCPGAIMIDQRGHPTAKRALAHGFRVHVLGFGETVRPKARVTEEVADRVGLHRLVVARGPRTQTGPCGTATIRLHFRPRARRKLSDESPLVVIVAVKGLFQTFKFRGAPAP